MRQFITIALISVLAASSARAAPKFRARAWTRDRRLFASELRAIAESDPASKTDARSVLAPAVEHLVRLNQRVRKYPDDARGAIFAHVVKGAFGDVAEIKTDTLRRIARDLARETGREAGTLGDPVARALIRRAHIFNYAVNAMSGASVITVATYELFISGPNPSRYAEIFVTSIIGYVALECLPDLKLIEINEMPSVLRECERRLNSSEDHAIEGPST